MDSRIIIYIKKKIRMGNKGGGQFLQRPLRRRTSCNDFLSKCRIQKNGDFFLCVISSDPTPSDEWMVESCRNRSSLTCSWDPLSELGACIEKTSIYQLQLYLSQKSHFSEGFWTGVKCNIEWTGESILQFLMFQEGVGGGAVQWRHWSMFPYTPSRLISFLLFFSPGAEFFSCFASSLTAIMSAHFFSLWSCLVDNCRQGHCYIYIKKKKDHSKRNYMMCEIEEGV